MSSALVAQVVGHLDAQIASARRLLGLVLAQGQAIRARDVEQVVLRLEEIRTEMAARSRLEAQRGALLAQAGAALATPPTQVTLEALTSLMSPADAAEARRRSAELRGLLSEIVREHGVNRALMRQELAFLEHLVRLVGDQPDTGYRMADHGPTRVATARTAAPDRRVLDLQA